MSIAGTNLLETVFRISEKSRIAVRALVATVEAREEPPEHSMFMMSVLTAGIGTTIDQCISTWVGIAPLGLFAADRHAPTCGCCVVVINAGARGSCLTRNNY